MWHCKCIQITKKIYIYNKYVKNYSVPVGSFIELFVKVFSLAICLRLWRICVKINQDASYKIHKNCMIL